VLDSFQRTAVGDRICFRFSFTLVKTRIVEEMKKPVGELTDLIFAAVQNTEKNRKAFIKKNQKDCF
jgi:hypothetical protein